ncbi:alpha/beta hydrolase (plasmid) [Nostoc edaphicum CCNP1411]|uniref:Alpha/beta hydrolase n=1 Tax=Nostoc edaphicum CCNP1411 TaxID=1472755 RepID=A0A7D7L844_9NOSO|nr:alpha/beta hydrolase [Nostoc edaphicum]QMS86253.1 alpha/beta hydrolase [Nostoc edaphicum CCNP1411]
MIKVTFDSKGTNLVGNLYIPDNLSEPTPAVVIIGPMTFVKEQSPTEYAKRLVKEGFITLTFDARYRGESGGSPRNYENPMAKVEDVTSAINFLISRQEVNANNIMGLGICAGSGVMSKAASSDQRIKVLATVAGHYRDQESDLAWLGTDGLAARLEKSKAAKAKFEEIGEVEYIDAVDPVRTDVAMPGKAVWDYYGKWAEMGKWENRYAVISDIDLLAFETATAAQKIKQPYLMIHSDNSFIPDAAHRHFERVPGNDKKLLWEGQNSHLQYYDDPVVIDNAVKNIADWYNQHLH